MKFLLPFLLVISGCAANTTHLPKSVPPEVQHASRTDCVRVYYAMIGMVIRDNKEPDKEYTDEELDIAIDNLHQTFLLSGVTDKTINECMQLNVKQVACMRGAMTLQAISDCESFYANKK